MTTKWKRHERVKNNPANVRFDDAVTWLLSFGFEEREAKGSHKVFTHAGWDGRLTMQSHKGKAKPYQIRQAIRAIEEICHV
jgi:predicted RNA binding protein YcfA (HicA-like mRNA interferase family)